MAERNTVKVVDRGWDKIRGKMTSRRYTAGGGRAASVGIQGDEAQLATEEHGGMTNVELGVIHEFGSKDGQHPPERSSIRSTFDQQQKKYQAWLDKVAKAGFDGKEMEGELLLLGEQCRTDIVNKVRSGIPPPLAEATVAQKGGEATPLIRTGQWLNSFRATMVNPEDLK